MDATGGTNYAMIGTTQMMSVPYALYAKSSGSNVTIDSLSQVISNLDSLMGIITPLFGCAVPIACNYDPLAIINDGSCIFPDGCTDSLYLEYDATAQCDDSSCATLIIYGCTDSTACNYDGSATNDDGSCVLPDGCTDPTACNYDSTALCDDGSCSGLLGCTDSTACGYNPLATCDNGLCSGIPGCIDNQSSNYNALATCDDGSCIPYVGMYGLGGIIYKISGNTAYIVNIHHQEFTSRFLSNCSAIVNALTTDGYTDWQIPSETDLDDICPSISFIDAAASNYPGTVMFGSNEPYVSSASFCNSGNNGSGPYLIPYNMHPTGCCPAWGECELGGYSGNCCCQVADFWLRSIRITTF